MSAETFNPQSAFANPRLSTRMLFGLLAIIIVALVMGGRAYYRHEVGSIRREKDADLQAIAELKVGQIVAWRRERLTDARLNSSGIIRSHALQWLRARDDETAMAALLSRLQMFREAEGYQNMMLADPGGRLLLTAEASLSKLEDAARQLVARSVAEGEPVFGELFRCPDCSQVHLDVAGPILDDDGRTVAVLLLRTDPNVQLYPLVQSWPTPSESAETLLIRKEGESALFLNTLRHSSAPALTLGLPMERPDLPAALALGGRTGIFEGKDYRGVPVEADLRPVPDSPWAMIAKMDLSEIRAEASYRGVVVMIILALATLMVGLVAVLAFGYRQRSVYRQLYHAERSQREGQEEIRATFYGIGDGVIATDANSRVTRMNPVAEQLTGWGESEAIGRPIGEIFRIINEETRAPVENPVTRVLREHAIVGLANHTLLIARDGSERPIADSGAPIRAEPDGISGVVLVFRDQTDERAVQAELRRSEERYRKLFATAGDAIFVLSQESGSILDANDAATKMYGYTREELFTLKNTDLSAEPEQTAQALVQERKVTPIRRHRRKDGSVFPVEINATYYDQDGQRVSVVDIRDISERELAREQEEAAHLELQRHLQEARQSRRALLSMMEDQKLAEEEREHMRAQLQQAQKLESVGTLAGGVAHEINNPIMGIMNYAELILDELGPDSPVSEFAREIGHETERVATIVKNLLSFARQDKETHSSPARVSDIVGSTLSLCQAVMRHDQIVVETDVPEDLPEIKCRSQQIRQVVMNLLTNARDALNAKYPEYHEDKKILISASVIAESAIRITVEDHGSGISADVRERMFEPFFTTKPRDKGTGLGLSISHGIIKDHGGEVSVESEVGQWTRFHVDLSVIRASDPQAS